MELPPSIGKRKHHALPADLELTDDECIQMVCDLSTRDLHDMG